MADIASTRSKLNDIEIDQGSALSEALFTKFGGNQNADFRGRWTVGDVKLHHSYNGLVGPGPGWMLCDGRQISSTTYETEHGVGTWSTEVGSTPLDGLYLPDFTSNKFPAGAATTTQSGAAPITTVGNSGSTINIQHSHTVTSHTHTVASHNHQYYSVSGSDPYTIETFDVNGANKNLNEGDTNSSSNGFETDTGGVHTDGGLFTSKNSLITDATAPGTNTALSTTQSVKPHSIEVQYYMRVVSV